MLKDVLKKELLSINLDVSKIDLGEIMATGCGCDSSSCAGNCSVVPW